MPRMFSPEMLARYADPAALTQTAAPSAPSSGPNWMHRIGLPALAGGQGLDAATTLMPIAGTREANPVFGSQPGAARTIATKAAVMVPLALLLNHIYSTSAARSGARKAALITALGAGGAGAAAGIHNLRLR